MVPPVTEKVVFEQTIEGLFVRGLAKKMTLRCSERLKAAGVDLNRKLLPAYPAETWFKAIEIASEEIFPGDSKAQAARRLGEQFIEGFRETLLGRAVLALLKVIGPRQALIRATRNFRSGNNYTESRLTELSPTSFELWMNEVGPQPTFTAGIIAAGLNAAGASQTAIEVISHDGHAASYRVSWS